MRSGGTFGSFTALRSWGRGMAREQGRRRVAGVFAWRRATHSRSAPSALALRSAFGLAPGQPRLAKRGAMRRDQVAL